MRSFLFNPGSVRAGKRISGKGLLKTFLMAGILITSLPETGSAQGPVFYNGGSYSKIVCFMPSFNTTATFILEDELEMH